MEREKDVRLNPAAKKKKLPSVTQKVFNLDKPHVKEGIVAFEPYEMETVIEVPAYLENRPSTSPKPPLLFSQQKAMKTDLHNNDGEAKTQRHANQNHRRTNSTEENIEMQQRLNIATAEDLFSFESARDHDQRNQQQLNSDLILRELQQQNRKMTGSSPTAQSTFFERTQKKFQKK